MSRIFDPRNPNLPPPVAETPPVDEWQVKMLAALDQLAAAVLDKPQPVIEVPPVDLGGIVQAVQALNGPATADEIAGAVVRALGTRQEPDTASASLTEVAEALKKLEFRLQGVGTQAYGGGSVSFSPQALAQLTEALTDSNVAVVPVVATITAAGDTTVYTPAAGKAVRLHWVSAINDPDEATSPLIKIKLGSDELYRAYAIAHRQVFEGAADAALVVNLSGAASVAFTAHIEEYTP